MALGHPDLWWLIAAPVLGGCAAWGAARWSAGAARWIAIGALTVLLGLALPYVEVPGIGATESRWLAEFRVEWMPRFGIGFHLAIDGFSALLIVLTAVLGLIAVLCSWLEIDDEVGFFHANLLLNLAGVVGVFLAIDLVLFFMCWEAMLVPMFLLIVRWGHGSAEGRGRVYAALKFFIYTQASGLLMLVAIVWMGWLHRQITGDWSFDYADWLAAGLPATATRWAMWGFFVAFAVKLPAFPVHAWLPDAHSQAPTAGSVILAGVLLKTGAYGLVRFGLELFPAASVEIAPIAMTLGVVGILWGAALAMTQTDLKRFIAYTSVSHMGFVLLGAYSGSITALQGVMLLLLAHGLSTGALFVLCGSVYERLHTRDLLRIGGLAQQMPRYGGLFTFFCVASLGIPGTGNFIAEFLILAGSLPVAPGLTATAATGLIAAAVYSLLLVQRVLHGPPQHPSPVEDLLPREQGMLGVALALLLLLGLFPQPVLDAAHQGLVSALSPVTPR